MDIKDIKEKLGKYQECCEKALDKCNEIELPLAAQVVVTDLAQSKLVAAKALKDIDVEESRKIAMDALGTLKGVPKVEMDRKGLESEIIKLINELGGAPARSPKPSMIDTDHLELNDRDMLFELISNIGEEEFTRLLKKRLDELQSEKQYQLAKELKKDAVEAIELYRNKAEGLEELPMGETPGETPEDREQRLNALKMKLTKDASVLGEHGLEMLRNNSLGVFLHEHTSLVSALLRYGMRRETEQLVNAGIITLTKEFDGIEGVEPKGLAEKVYDFALKGSIPKALKQAEKEGYKPAEEESAEEEPAAPSLKTNPSEAPNGLRALMEQTFDIDFLSEDKLEDAIHNIIRLKKEGGGDLAKKLDSDISDTLVGWIKEFIQKHGTDAEKANEIKRYLTEEKLEVLKKKIDAERKIINKKKVGDRSKEELERDDLLLDLYELVNRLQKRISEL